MKAKLNIVLLLLCTILFSSSINHPLKLTSTEIKYDAKANSLRIECKVFVDDFSPAISSTLIANINRSNLSKNDLNRIEYYFLDKFKIALNSKLLPWKIKSYDVDGNVLSLIFCHENINIKKGDRIEIENALLFEVFGNIQSNWMTLRFPPYFHNSNFESKIFHPIYSHNF